MSHSGPTLDQFDFLRRVVLFADGGVPMCRPFKDEMAVGLAKLGLIECRRSDAGSETWWPTDKGRNWLKPIDK
jgi:hypothetical protein